MDECLIVNFGEYGGDEAKTYLNSKPRLSLMLAGKFLDKIPGRARNDPAGWLQDEMAIEGFLFFTVAAVDGLYQEINKRLCRMKERSVCKRTIVEYLGKNGDVISTQIRKIIEDATDEPKWTTTEVPGQDPGGWPTDWDRSRSWLWEIVELRNKITHRSIAGRHLIVSLPAGDVDASIIITKMSDVKCYLKKANGTVDEIGINNTKSIREDKPSEYFRGCFQKMEQMVSGIQGLLARVPTSGKP